MFCSILQFIVLLLTQNFEITCKKNVDLIRYLCVYFETLEDFKIPHHR